MLVTKRYVESIFGPRLTLWIDPRKVRFSVGTKRPVVGRLRARIRAMRSVPVLPGVSLALLDAVEPFVIPERHYREPRPVENEPRYRRVRDLLDQREDLRASAWHQQLVCDLRERGVATHKRLSMHSEGEIDQVGKDGELHKSGSASHRFYIAQLLGVKPIPVRIAGVHSGCWSSRPNRGVRAGLTQLLRDVERNHQ